MKISNAADEDHWSNNETWSKNFGADLMSELKASAGRGCGNCYPQDCDWPRCSPRAMEIKEALASQEKSR